MIAKRSLARRMLLLAVGWASVLFVIGWVGLTSIFANAVTRNVDDRLEGAVRALVAEAEVTSTGEVAVAIGPTDPRYAQVLSGRYWMVARLDASGRPVVGAMSRSLFEQPLQLDPAWMTRLAEVPGLTETTAIIGPDQEPLRVMARALVLEPSDAVLVFIAGEDTTQLAEDIARFNTRTLLLLAVLAAGLIGAVIVQVRLGLAPLFALRNQVAEIREGERASLDDDAPVELEPLARELNALIAHNRDVVERARAHVGNLAHALKTPIAVLLNESSAAPGPGLPEVVERQASVMARQVDHHLKRASAAARAQTLGARTLVTPILEDLARTLPRMYPDRVVAVTISAPPEAVFRGERQDFEEIAGNLLDNAFKWAGGAVRVTVEDADEQGRVELSVEDDGPGLTPEDCQKALRRGERLDEAAPGSGLGLSIVDELARAYGGALFLEVASLGGLRARVILPGSDRLRSTQR